MTSAPCRVGYCLNIHPAVDLAMLLGNLSVHSSAVRTRLVGDGTIPADQPLDVGLWLSEEVLSDVFGDLSVEAWESVAARDAFGKLSETLEQHQLRPFSINGFPQHNFHQPVVKHAVYEPTWWQPQRLRYTCRLIDLLASLLPEGEIGSISTLPIAWRLPRPTAEQMSAAVDNLIAAARYAHRIFEKTGRKIVLAIEPEPGCVLGDCSAARIFFMRHLFAQESAIAREYLTVCHDICHASVMREDQRRQIQAYRDCGVRIGKVQVSSAVHVDWDQMTDQERAEAFTQVQGFAESRYLHQTTTRNGPVGSVRFVDDLIELLESISAPERLVGNWTIHFHVPIQVERLGQLRTTRTGIDDVLTALNSAPDTPLSNGRRTEPVDYKRLMDPSILQDGFTGHFEIETYAWPVMPEKFRPGTIVDDLSAEIRYFHGRLQASNAATATRS